MILTTPRNLKAKAIPLLSIWVSKVCSNYRFLTILADKLKKENKNTTNESQYLVEEPLNIYQPKELIKESYDKLTDKVWYSFKDIYKQFPNYKWYMKLDDDTFIHARNLIAFLESNNASIAQTFGYDIVTKWFPVEGGFHAGGSGYVMSHKAFHILGEQLVKNFNFCVNTGIEDLDTAKCFRKLNVFPGNSTDKDGLRLFNPYNFAKPRREIYVIFTFNFLNLSLKNRRSAIENSS
jgi:hypothetical protein